MNQLLTNILDFATEFVLASVFLSILLITITLGLNLSVEPMGDNLATDNVLGSFDQKAPVNIVIEPNLIENNEITIEEIYRNSEKVELKITINELEQFSHVYKLATLYTQESNATYYVSGYLQQDNITDFNAKLILNESTNIVLDNKNSQLQVNEVNIVTKDSQDIFVVLNNNSSTKIQEPIIIVVNILL
jgi:hypothetical protein